MAETVHGDEHGLAASFYMGGFILQDGAQRSVLNGYSTRRLENAATVIPKITKKEIMDKSKSNGASRKRLHCPPTRGSFSRLLLVP
ncbi:hypothetical protein BDN67DRAFT_963720 [Paxillus ammoniavirescens]|nr:hypothetical protein BDN67DRAFT_963720 [Paxillus ammoniavirescens]